MTARPRQRLRKRRMALNLSQEAMAQKCDLATTTYGDYERGVITPRIGAQRRRLAYGLEIPLDELDRYIVDDETVLEQRLAVGGFNIYVSLELTATRMRTWQPSVVPGMLQTPDYAAAIVPCEEGVRQRIERQALITREDEPLDLSVVVDESVLYRPIGGPDVLAGQLDHLAAIAQRPNVDLRVLPLKTPTQPITEGAVVLLGFPWADDGLVYVEHRSGEFFLNTSHDITRHVAAFRSLTGLALSPDDSIDLIQSLTKELYNRD